MPQVMSKFYSKPDTSRMNMLHRSAMPEGQKVVTTKQRIFRRLKTNSERVAKADSEQILKIYMDNKKSMGYSILFLILI